MKKIILIVIAVIIFIPLGLFLLGSFLSMNTGLAVSGSSLGLRLFMLVLISLLALIILLNRKNKIQKSHVETKKIVKKIFDYRKESLRLLVKSKEDFTNKRYKDAYSKASQAIRVYLSYKHSLNKEITNTDLIKYLRKNKLDYRNVKVALDLCAMVEFARYKANIKDFNKIIQSAERIIL